MSRSSLNSNHIECNNTVRPNTIGLFGRSCMQLKTQEHKHFATSTLIKTNQGRQILRPIAYAFLLSTLLSTLCCGTPTFTRDAMYVCLSQGRRANNTSSQVNQFFHSFSQSQGLCSSLFKSCDRGGRSYKHYPNACNSDRLDHITPWVNSYPYPIY